MDDGLHIVGYLPINGLTPPLRELGNRYCFQTLASLQAASDDLRWPQMAPDGLRWPQMASDGLRWPQMALDFKLTKVSRKNC